MVYSRSKHPSRLYLVSRTCRYWWKRAGWADTKAREVVTLGTPPQFPLYSNLSKARRKILNQMITPAHSLKVRIPDIDIGASSSLSLLASGCCALNSYLFQIRKVADPSCHQCGYRKETPTHFFQFCPAYTS